jgi:glyoxylase-like metal-dependent hydrolase (beta-lactamase superfamily II)
MIDEVTMDITLFGTRGGIEESSPLHRVQSACRMSCEGKRLLLDAGATWAESLHELGAHWIAINHAHPDHAFGLENAAKIPEYATRPACESLASRFPLVDFRLLEPNELLGLGPFVVTAYPVVHSARSQAS